MRVRELIAELIWRMRFLDPFFYVFLIWMKIERAKKEEREEILRAVYDIRVKDDALTHLKKDYLVRLFFVSLLSVFLLFILLLF